MIVLFWVILAFPCEPVRIWQTRILLIQHLSRQHSRAHAVFTETEYFLRNLTTHHSLYPTFTHVITVLYPLNYLYETVAAFTKYLPLIPRQPSRSHSYQK